MWLPPLGFDSGVWVTQPFALARGERNKTMGVRSSQGPWGLGFLSTTITFAFPITGDVFCGCCLEGTISIVVGPVIADENATALSARPNGLFSRAQARCSRSVVCLLRP